MRGPGQYVVAGSDTYVQLMGRFMDNNPTYFSDQHIADFMDQNINKFLYSFGAKISYKTKKLSKRHDKAFLKKIHQIRSRSMMDKTELYWDSGGYQISNGGIKTEDMPRFIDLYYNTILNNPDLFEYAFILDIPPGPGSIDIFNSYKQIEDFNRFSYQKCLDTIPEEIRKDRIIYIHHFRTPSLYRTWHKYLFEEGLAEGYNYFGTGGIVANISSDILIPIILYTIPLSSIITYVKQQKMKSFRFHILGGANLVDVFYHKLFSHHIKHCHGLDINITYDSSAIFKGLTVGRFIHIRNKWGNIVKVNMKSDVLHLKFDPRESGIEETITTEQKLYQLCNMVAMKYGFKELNPADDPIYDPRTNALNRSVHMYLFCYILELYRDIEIEAEKFSEEVYHHYLAGDKMKFDEQCINFVKSLSRGKPTKKQRAKTFSIYNSLDILKNLDLDYNENLVNKYMSSDDINMYQQDDNSILKF